MPPTEPQNQTPQPLTNAPVPPLGQPSSGMPVQPTPPVKSKAVPILLGVIIVLVVLAIAGWVYASSKNKNSSNASNQAATTNPVTPVATSSTDKAATTAKTADTVDTLCYSFTLPTPHDDIGSDNRCTSSYMYGKDKVASIIVDTPVVPQVASLAELVTNWKKYNSDTIVSETKTTLGAYDAQKIVTKKTSVSGTTSNITLLVYTADKYKIQNITVNGFELRGRYDDQYGSKAGVDSILDSWQWK